MGWGWGSWVTVQDQTLPSLLPARFEFSQVRGVGTPGPGFPGPTFREGGDIGAGRHSSQQRSSLPAGEPVYI